MFSLKTFPCVPKVWMVAAASTFLLSFAFAALFALDELQVIYQRSYVEADSQPEPATQDIIFGEYYGS